MNYFTRGLLSIKRKPGKFLILLVLILVLCNIIAGAVSVKTALANTQATMKEKIRTEVTASIDFDSLFKNVGGEENQIQLGDLTDENITNISKSSYVKETIYKTKTSMNSKNLEKVGDDSGFILPSFGGEGDSFDLVGGNTTTIDDVKNEKISITSGRSYTQEEIDNGDKVILISKELAEKNNLAVGDKVTLNSSIFANSNSAEQTMITNPETLSTEEYEFEVIGIFEAKKEATSENGAVSQQTSSKVNIIYTTTSALTTISDDLKTKATELGGNTSFYLENDTTFILNSPDDLELFTAENKQYLPSGYVFKDNTEQYQQMVAPMANMSWIADLILYVAIGATVLIISLLTTLFLKDRRHEMGIYLALGEKKGKIAFQILTEVMLIALIAVSLSIFTGNKLAQNMSKTMLQNQLIEAANQNDTSKNNGTIFIGGDETEVAQISTDDVVSSYDVSLKLNTILLIYGIGIGSVAISTLIPIAYTLRLNPKKILL